MLLWDYKGGGHICLRNEGQPDKDNTDRIFFVKSGREEKREVRWLGRKRGSQQKRKLIDISKEGQIKTDKMLYN